MVDLGRIKYSLDLEIMIKIGELFIFQIKTIANKLLNIDYIPLLWSLFLVIK